VAQHVLVVDDDLLECELLQRTLHGADIQALTLTDSRQASEILRNHTFDAIFLDVNMPPPDGMELTRQIRASQSNQKTAIIMITGSDDSAVVARGFQAGINFFLYKPINKDRLLNLVRVTQSVNRVEKRRFHRVAVRQKVEVQFNHDILEGNTIDVSLNGLLVHVSQTVPVSSRVKVRISLSPGKTPLAVGGTVTRVPSPDSMGIHLDAIGMNESRQLQDFLLPLMITSKSAVLSE
jgi:DNA-binding response OmpR family regulator